MGCSKKGEITEVEGLAEVAVLKRAAMVMEDGESSKRGPG
jgi:hypothetical protein